jgi:signal transduction histidine kinase
MVIDRHKRRLAGEKPPGTYSFRVRNKLGNELWVELTAVSILWRERPATLNFLRDITEQRRLEVQFLQAQKMEAVGRLAGGIAHDFNNLLTIINTNAQLSLMDLKDWDPLKEKLESIQTAGGRAADLTRQLLAFSRRQVVEMKVIDLNALLQELEKMLTRVMGEDIELGTRLGKDLGRIKADPGQIEQIILNLVVNAKDAMPSGGKLTIETANMEMDQEYVHTHLEMKPGRYVMLSVSDTGVGMTPEVRERVFEPFFTTKEKGKGTGLGLSTVYGVVKQSGGYIWVYSERGQGTTFKIYLPRVDEPLEEEVRKKVVKEELPGGKETILVVEDEEEVRKLAVAILRKQGYRILEASNGGDAFLICEQGKEPVRLLLTDVVMPGLNGPELARRLRYFYPEMKVLFMSGYTDNGVLQQGVLDHGMFFLQKPFSVDGLTGKVRSVLDR